MKSLIYVEVVNQISVTYEKGLISKVKKLIPEVETFDLDSYSDPSLFNYAIDLIRKSDQCAIFFKTEKEAPTGRMMLLLEEILKNKDTSLVILYGENKLIEKISKQLNKFESSPNPDSALQRMMDFFKTGQ